MPRLMLALLLLLPTLAAFADTAIKDEDAQIRQLIADARMDMKWSAAQQWTGPGATWLSEQARASRFVLMGEPHYTNEAARFFQRMLAELADDGFNVLAVEMGPHTTRQIEREAGLGAEMLSTFEALHPDSAAFLGADAEREFLLAARRLNYRFWGLDQEFVLSGTRWLEWLSQRPAAAEHDSWFGERLESARAADEAFREQQDPSGLFLISQFQEHREHLSAMFAEDSEAGALIEELSRSARIYQLFGAGELYASNAKRIAMIKRHFWQRWHEETRKPRIVFKFGSYHMGRGLTPAAQFDLGNLAHELAVSMGESSFHLRVLGKRRQTRTGFSELAESEPDLQILAEACPNGQWCVFDMSKLREQAFRGQRSSLTDGLRDAAFAYDALVLAPELTSSR